MRKFSLIYFPLFLLTILIFHSFFYNPVHAQAVFFPPFYCLGANCSTAAVTGSPIPIIATNPSEENQPCGQAKSNNRGFLVNIFGFFMSFLDPSFNSNQDSVPCTPVVPPTAPIITPGTSTPAPHTLSSGNPSSTIQFVDHRVVQVPGRDMLITVEKLTNVLPGDILVAMIGSDYAHVNSLPPGWKSIRQDVKNAGHIDDLAMQSYYKIVTSSEEASYTWNLVTGRDDTPSDHQPLIAVDLYAFRGVNQNNPIFSIDARGETRDPHAIECPSVKGVTGGMLICAYIGDDPGPITMPNSMQQTSNFEIAGGDSYAIGYEALTSSNDTGPRNASWDNPDRNKNGSDFSQAIVLRPL